MWVSHMRTLQVSAACILMRIVFVTMGIIVTNITIVIIHIITTIATITTTTTTTTTTNIIVMSIHAPSSTRLSTVAI
jgi:hypothetical protein